MPEIDERKYKDYNKTTYTRFISAVSSTINGPVDWFRKKVVEPNQKHYCWYHEKFRRVPTVDECYVGDVVCEFEADQQFKRDKLVDSEILNILRYRMEDCMMYEHPDADTKCKHLRETYDEAAGNWFAKYGDLGVYQGAKAAFFKQKHRMIWERRHGPVGSGMKCPPVEDHH